MIILDTNVVYEAMRVGRNVGVVAWLDRQTVETLYLTAISLSELSLGVQLLPAGKRKEEIQIGLGNVLQKLFGSRVLPFDREAALAYGTLVSAARARGKTISMPDGQIASIASVHGFTVATRDTAPFVALGVPTLNPWKAR